MAGCKFPWEKTKAPPRPAKLDTESLDRVYQECLKDESAKKAGTDTKHEVINKARKKSHKQLAKIKRETDIEKLIDKTQKRTNIPGHMLKKFHNYICHLEWNEQPDYTYLDKLIKREMQKIGVKMSDPYDWEDPAKSVENTKHSKISSNKENKKHISVEFNRKDVNNNWICNFELKYAG